MADEGTTAECGTYGDDVIGRPVSSHQSEIPLKRNKSIGELWAGSQVFPMKVERRGAKIKGVTSPVNQEFSTNHKFLGCFLTTRKTAGVRVLFTLTVFFTRRNQATQPVYGLTLHAEEIQALWVERQGART